MPAERRGETQSQAPVKRIGSRPTQSCTRVKTFQRSFPTAIRLLRITGSSHPAQINRARKNGGQYIAIACKLKGRQAEKPASPSASPIGEYKGKEKEGR